LLFGGSSPLSLDLAPTFHITRSQMKPGWMGVVEGFLSTSLAQLNYDPLWNNLDGQVRNAVEKFDGEMDVAIVDRTRDRHALKTQLRIRAAYAVSSLTNESTDTDRFG